MNESSREMIVRLHSEGQSTEEIAALWPDGLVSADVVQQVIDEETGDRDADD